MASSLAAEREPLLAEESEPRPTPATKPTRNVTFNPQISTASPPRRRPAFPPASTQSSSAAAFPTLREAPTSTLSSLNTKLRRRNSSGATLQFPPFVPGPKIGPQRTSRTAQKLKLLPNPEHGEDGPDEESGRDVYSQFTRIKDPTARRDAARLGKEDRARLPRVTAYCTAGSYRLDDLMRFLKGRTKTKSANPKLFDECLYSPYSYRKDTPPRRDGTGASGNQQTHPEQQLPAGQTGQQEQQQQPQPQQSQQQDGQQQVEENAHVQSQPQRRFSDSVIEVDENVERRREDLIDLNTQAGDTTLETGESSHPINLAVEEGSISTVSDDRQFPPNLDTTVHVPEVFLFDYGVVVIWGMTEKEEVRFLKEISKFEQEKLGKDDIQTEEFNFYYTREYQARIYNDFISLREKRNYMTKIAISHALAQSTKTSLYEDLVDDTITATQGIPSQIAATGRINLTRREINMQIGDLFILRINIHLQGSVLDAPELMWAEPQLEPVYQAVRTYLEMDQRVALLQERVGVIADLLAVLKDQLSHTHGEYLEWIVIVLIAAEILVAAINIVVDLYAGGE